MEVKKFEAPTLAEALQVVKRELGPEAVVLSTKNKRSAFGLMNKSSVEVTAAINPAASECPCLPTAARWQDRRHAGLKSTHGPVG